MQYPVRISDEFHETRRGPGAILNQMNINMRWLSLEFQHDNMHSSDRVQNDWWIKMMMAYRAFQFGVLFALPFGRIALVLFHHLSKCVFDHPALSRLSLSLFINHRNSSFDVTAWIKRTSTFSYLWLCGSHSRQVTKIIILLIIK